MREEFGVKGAGGWRESDDDVILIRLKCKCSRSEPDKRDERRYGEIKGTNDHRKDELCGTTKY